MYKEREEKNGGIKEEEDRKLLGTSDENHRL